MSAMTDAILKMAEEQGIDPASLEEGKPQGRPWQSHAEFLDADALAVRKLNAAGDGPPRAAYREAWEQEEAARKARHLRTFGTEAGFIPRQPCGGMMIVEESELAGNGPMLCALCDTCGFRIGIRRQAFDPSYMRKRLFAQSGMPSRYVGKRMDEFQGQRHIKEIARQYVGDMWARPEPITLPAPSAYGGVGVGKSHMICSIAETLIRKYEVNVRYWTLAGLLDKARMAFDTSDATVREAARAAWEQAMNVDVLLLDDIGAEKPTEWAQEKFQTLVDHRYTAEKPIIVASNVPAAEWPEMFGQRTASRLKAMTLLTEMTGEDRRGHDFDDFMPPPPGAQRMDVDPATGEVQQ